MTDLFNNVGNMKNSSKVIYLVITGIVVTLVGVFICAKKNEDLKTKEQVRIQKNISSDRDRPKVKASIADNTSSLSYTTSPKWAKSIITINDNPENSREDKISKLVVLLKQNEANPDALKAILISMTVLNPIEAADDIIPYLKNTNTDVQIAALGALHNASLFTQKEHELKHSLTENEAIRKRITIAVDELKVDPNITVEVRQVLNSIYTASHSSLKNK